MLVRFFSLSLLLIGLSATAAEEALPSPESGKPPLAEFVTPDDVLALLEPLFTSITQATATRATVNVSTDSVSGGEVIDSKESTYQIASRIPDLFTIYLKEENQRTRIYGNDKKMIVRLSPEAYYTIDKPISLAEAVVSLPLPMGPYPEPVLALTLAGVDPKLTFLTGMKSIEVIDRDKFRGTVPAVHLKGEQDDGVTWDFWITQDKSPIPLRLLFDLTAMLKRSGELQVPPGFAYQVRFDFLSWRVAGEVPDALFSFTPPEDAVEYESLEDYVKTLEATVPEHPLLGKIAPEFAAKTLAGETIATEDLKDKIVVIDFWATWCPPCIAALPTIQNVCEEFKEQGVVFLPLNVSEEEEVVKEFLETHGWEMDPIMDAGGIISDAFKADAIPQTVVIGKSGVIESVHLGFAGEEELARRLRDELEVLSIGGRIASQETE